MKKKWNGIKKFTLMLDIMLVVLIIVPFFVSVNWWMGFILSPILALIMAYVFYLGKIGAKIRGEDFELRFWKL